VHNIHISRHLNQKLQKISIHLHHHAYISSEVVEYDDMLFTMIDATLQWFN